MKMRIAGLICGAAALIPTVSGAALTVADNHPSVTDASVKAMRFIQKNAKEEEAVVASWWDMGYFYQSESGHPCLWDGGTQNDSIRGLLISKALTSDDLNLSRRILLMLSASGNSAVEFLIRHTDIKTAFDALYEALVVKEEEGLAILQDRCSLSEGEAEEVWVMMRPEVTKEAYLILTYTMTRQIGWYEYYAGWDFTGTQEPPSTTWFSYTPEGTPLFRSEEGQEYLANVREKETIWRLFFNAEPTPCFTPVYESHDGLEHVRIWKIEE